VVPNASITLTNTSRNTADRRTSNEVGRFLFTNLIPGAYRLEASAPGFAPKTISDLVLTVDQKRDVTVTLELGATEQKVVVSAERLGLETATPTVGQVVDNRQIANLPLNGRQSLALIALVPNVRVGPGFDPSRFDGVGWFSINDGRTNGAAVMIDGTPAMGGLGAWQNPAYKPSIDGVQEFRVMTNTLSAEFGVTDGGAVSIVSKSGSNTPHGSAYNYLRNSQLDANNFFNNRSGIPLGSFKRNQFGGTLGGPLVLPKVYDGRNRTFFFVSYEGLRSSTGVNAVRTVPTELEKQGDFSQNRNSAGQPIVIYDPLTTRPNPAGAGYVRTPFSGNLVPSTRMDPVSRNLLRYWPKDNNPGLSFTGANNLVLGVAARYNSDQADYRLDHRFNDRHSAYGRFSHSRDENIAPRPFGYADPDRVRRVPTKHAVLDYTWVKSNVTVVNLHYGYSLLGDSGEAYHRGPGFQLQELGFSSGFVRSTPDELKGLPQFGPSDISTISGGYSFRSPYEIHQYSGSVSHVRGRHTVKAGGDIRRYLYWGFSNNTPAGVFGFPRSYTQGPDPLRATATAGIGFASFLLGAGSGTSTIRPHRGTRSPALAGYLQDDWKISRKLTVNVGFRYDLFVPGTDPRNELSWFDALVGNPLSERTGLDLRGGLRFAGQGEKRSPFEMDWNNFSPRIGLAYSVTPRLVIRSGFGLLYPLARTGPSYTQDGFTAATTWVSALDGLTPTSFLRDAFSGGPVQPTRGAEGLLTLVGESLAPANPTDTSTYNLQWNFTVQRDLPGNSLVEISYLVNRGVHLAVGEGVQINQLRPELLSLGSRLLDPVPNPFYGIIKTGVLSGANTTRGQLLRPYPQFNSIVLDRTTWANSVYHAFGLRWEQRYKHGHVLQASYTNSKVIDDSSVTTTWAGPYVGAQNYYDLRSERSLGSQDISQNLVLSFQAPLPFGKGQPWLAKANPVAAAILGGWQFNGIFTKQTGFPIGITAPNTTGSLGGGQRPNSTGQSAELSGRIQDRLGRYFDGSQFLQPSPFSFGNVSRTLPDVRRPGLTNLDLSLFKDFPLGETWRFQFRVEAFNLTNTPLFGLPGTTLAAPTFGVISSQANLPRQVQLALRLDF
jgi:hypothetical protein